MLTKFNLLYEQILLENRKDTYIEQLNNKHIDNSNELAEYIYSFNNPKKEKVALFWLLKQTIKLPKDQDKVDKAFNLIDKQHLNYQDFKSPDEIINRDDKSTLRINNQDQDFNPDTEPTFTNRKELGDGIVVYQVEDSREGQAAVRKAIDVNWGYDANPWCLATRNINFNEDGEEDELDQAWNYWYEYSAYPKRIVFKNNKLLAFCANNNPKIAWWDKNNNSSENIPETNVNDDLEFVKKYVKNFDLYLLQIPNCPIKIFEKFFKNSNIDIRYSVAKNPNCPPEILEKLSKSSFWKTKEFVADNPNCPIKVLIKLSNDNESIIRCSVAENPNCPPEILEKLSKDKDGYVRSNVAKNSKTPINILEKLSDDKNEYIRIYVAENLNCPINILEKLSNDKDEYIRICVAENPNCPIELLVKLSKDNDEDVKYIAKKQLKKLQK